jgi:hypothetical protein
MAALAHGAKTLQEIEEWGSFRGKDRRARQQAVCRSLNRLVLAGFAEATSRRRRAGVSLWPCKIFRLTYLGEVIWASG